ncbi:MAG: GNAT family N-acetyltransferase [Planctomycetota bacterium]|jgi:GNAT superfamily N-acetyltransferase
MDDLTLRKAGPNDSEFAYGVRKAAYSEYVQQAGGWDDVEQRRLHERRFRTQDFRVINVGGEDVGIMSVVVSADCLKVNQLFVLPQHQGRGIGRRCMRLAMERARRRGLPVRLRVMKVNPRARALYERLGLVRIGETDTHDLMEWRP